ncbi:MAG: phenylacetate--CoA ligase [Victivallales bacterium]|nr:phenylacetate--CoA ligase [Victivallales bacterium]
MDSRYWQEELETMPRKNLEALQLEKLKASVTRALKSPFYKEHFGSQGLSADSLQSVDDIQKFPFTCKDDLRDNWPFGLMSASVDDCVRMHCTSGTTGNPAAVLYNRHDLDSWANLVARSMWSTGARPNDIFQNMSGYGLFTGGLGFQNGAEKLGMLTIPAAAGNSKRQIYLMQAFGTTVAHSVPSYLGRLFAVFQEMGLDPHKDTKLKRFFIGAEPHSEETRLRIQEMFGVKAYNSFGMTEMNGPGVAFECEYQTGMHVWEDCYLIEIIDPDTLQRVPDGEWGEMVLTTLDREAMPIIRYRTHDLTRIIPGECACARTHKRFDRIKGRTDDMFIVKGCNIFPIQIERVLMNFPEIGTDYLIELTNEQGDDMTVKAELKPDLFTDNYPELESLKRKIAGILRDTILVTPKIQLVPHGSLPKTEGKAKRVLDLRKQ